MSHDGDLERVRDARGYDVGWASKCSCEWVGDLQETHGPALKDLLEHLAATRPTPKDGTG